MSAEDYIPILKEVALLEEEKRRRFFSDFVFPRLTDPIKLAPISYDFFKQRMNILKKTYIFKQGEKCDFIYIVKKGKVLLVKEEKVGKKRFEHTMILKHISPKIFKLGTIEKGGIFGEDSLIIESKNRFFSAIALTDVTLLRVTLNCFVGHLRRTMIVRDYVMENARKKIRMKLQLLKNQFSSEIEHINHLNSINLGLHSMLNVSPENDQVDSIDNEMLAIHDNSRRDNSVISTIYLGRQGFRKKFKDNATAQFSDGISVRKRAYKSIKANFENRIDKESLFGTNNLEEFNETYKEVLASDNSVFKMNYLPENRQKSASISVWGKKMSSLSSKPQKSPKINDLGSFRSTSFSQPNATHKNWGVSHLPNFSRSVRQSNSNRKASSRKRNMHIGTSALDHLNCTFNNLKGHLLAKNPNLAVISNRYQKAIDGVSRKNRRPLKINDEFEFSLILEHKQHEPIKVDRRRTVEYS